MLGAALVLGSLGGVAIVSQVSAGATTLPTSFKVVTASGVDGWTAFPRCFTPTFTHTSRTASTLAAAGDSVTFVKGPGTSPNGEGSVQLATGNGTTGGNCESAIRNSDYAGLPLADLTTLSYKSYTSENNTQQLPFIELSVNYGVTGSTPSVANDTLFFEPPYQTVATGNPTCPTQGKEAKTTWQTWTALHGCWWSNSGTFGNPGTGVEPLSDLLSTYPDAYIVNETQAFTTTGADIPALTAGGVAVAVGEATATLTYKSNVAQLTVGTTSAVTHYNFESPEKAPAFTSTATAYFSIRKAGQRFTITTTGAPAAKLTKSGTLPEGLHFKTNGNGTATVAGTPNRFSAGTYEVNVTAKNGVAPKATQTLTIVVGSAPVFLTADHGTFTAGSHGSVRVGTSGYPFATLSESGALPSGLAFEQTGLGTATIAGTPGTTTGGVYKLTISAANHFGTKTQTFYLTVDQAPAFTSTSSITVTPHVFVTFTVMAPGYPRPKIVKSGTLPKGLTFRTNRNGTATISGTPAASGPRTDNVQFTASNSVGSAVQTFTVTVG